MIGGLILLGAAPFDVSHNASSITTLAVAVVTDVLLAAVAILKGKPVLGLIGIFIPLVSLVGAVRLASPGSPWARRLYDPSGRKLRGRRRAGRGSRRVGGACRMRSPALPNHHIEPPARAKSVLLT